MNSNKKHTVSEQNRGSEAKDSPEKDDFFIPDLCNAQSVFVLVIASEMFALIVAIVAHPLPDFSWVSLAMVSLLVQWVTLSSAALICGLRPLLRQLNPRLAILACLLVVLLDTALFSFIGSWAVTPTFLNFSVWANLDYWLILQNLIIAFLIAGMVFRYFLLQHQLRVRESSELNARLQSLQSRIRPHFLFNSMNIIASLIAVDPDTAETVVEDLSELFRASLKETGNVVPLAEEIELCKKYSRIEQLRLGKRLEVDWEEVNFDETTYQTIEIPLLLLQPLLENAIYHGIQPRADGGTVKIKLDNQENTLVITLTNPLPGRTFHKTEAKQSKGNQMALNNIRHRLEAIYGDKGVLSQNVENEEFVTVLSFPKATLR